MTNRRSFLRNSLAAGLWAAVSANVAQANAPLVSLRPLARAGGPLGADANGGLLGLLQRAGLPGRAVCAVADVKTGKRLEEAGGTTALPPASVAKALTALYALDTLGAGHRFSTELVATGPVSGGVLQGDLVLSGGGDSMLSTDDLAQLARSLKTAGIREVRGDFRVWSGALAEVDTIDPGQPDHVGYSPAISGIALNFNRVHFEWKRGSGGWNVAMDARTAKYKPGVTMARMKIAQRKTPIYTYADKGGVDQWTVASAALGKGGARWLPVRRPAAYAGDVFRTLARSHGVILGAPKRAKLAPRGQVVAVHQSPELAVMLKGMLKYSNNLMAEMIGLSASRARGVAAKTLAQSASEMNRWAADRFGMTQTKLVDHSGLGSKSRMTPNDLVGALVVAHRDGQLKPLLKPFALRDSQGRIVKGHPIKVAAKTGTLNFVSGLGGFVTAQDGRELAFAIFTADEDARAGISRANRERPQGARSWNKRAKQLQQQLIERWDAVYGR
ncbi:D-alanyl-D-alanine carboxypeptidase/D-alanyl-D-alanine-endopeptidase [Epibacterium sp. SM1979]|uniref:D-alanyl-D-alanine carboxypeptidase/D-alanyl-D-alanine-endopeptidase n=1 Tax=Tritonibacter litoralis TaxID=2662264 RepID=A0A843YHS3_9RHOB|nr:D-alanyl-D-alanine carboxypeptidase/D-alanyl-D-alanine-endopeptidase [Tritonibacter litoralis]MQQ08974.1 D-alanyl-D-alanine carboxypeptidase/D-alanyl-D-alanine-endopeptidase [Tritonibacter litoralis]